jgi:hypothetical protein
MKGEGGLLCRRWEKTRWAKRMDRELQRLWTLRRQWLSISQLFKSSTFLPTYLSDDLPITNESIQLSINFVCLFSVYPLTQNYLWLVNTIFKVDASDKLSTAVSICKHTREKKKKPAVLWWETLCFRFTVLLLRQYAHTWRRRRHTDGNICECIKPNVSAPLQTRAAPVVQGDS